MTLISMLLALIIERLAVRSDAWQAHRYLQAYVSFSASTGLSKLAAHRFGQYLWLVLPGALVALVLCLFDNHLISIIVNTLVLLLAIGCWHFRQLYKQYLNALERGDDEAGFLAMEQIRQDSGSREQSSYGQVLVWVNFQYYAAVVFWFMLTGVFGVITYALVRHLQQPSRHVDIDQEGAVEPAYQQCIPADSTALRVVGHWLNWFPARLFGLGFALVGHFSRASSALLSYFLDFTADNEQVVTEVAAAAEPMPEQEQEVSCLEESSQMLQLAKRSMLFFLAFAAILTLGGWLA